VCHPIGLDSADPGVGVRGPTYSGNVTRTGHTGDDMSAHSVTPHEEPSATIIDSPELAEDLAEHLLDPERSKPVVVVTTAEGKTRPYIDVDEVISAVGDLNEVYVVPTGSITFAMSDRLPEKTQVYGGAGRVYPVDRTWQSDPFAAPMHFAFCSAQGPVVTNKLIADALGAAYSAGLGKKHVGDTAVHVKGEVKALFPPSRAWVRTDDDRHATIWQDLLLPGLTLERVFQVGMLISGVLDVEEGRIDVSASVRKPREALADYAVGAVVPARVVELDDIVAVVELYPGARTTMCAKDVTGNPMDRLTALMSADEVLTVRVTTRGGHDGRGWRLRMDDVEDTEEILASPSLLPGGPPWLMLAEAPPETSTAPSGIERTEMEGSRATSPPPCPSLVSSPQRKGESVPKPSPPRVDEGGTLRRRIADLEQLLGSARSDTRAVRVERNGFREQARLSHARLQELRTLAETARTGLRNEKRKSQRLEKQLRSMRAQTNAHSCSEVLFLDPEEQFRYDVDVAYAHRIPAADKASRPRREFRLGPDFLASLDSVEGVDRGKVVAVTVEVITDLDTELDSRGLHPLREGCGAAERDVVRPVDGARCMRVALQRKTPSARRLHYWKVGGAIELSRVVKHDDMTP
jgi:hypothetical protein